MEITPYLTFRGDCRRAFELYAATFGGTIEMMLTAGESPMAAQVPKERHASIMHARLRVGSTLLMGSDAPPEMYEKAQGFSVSVSVATPAEAERVFAALGMDGTVRMPLQQTFWATRFGMVTDRFGIPWMVNCEQAG